jgi:hypothetical protein
MKYKPQMLLILSLVFLLLASCSGGSDSGDASAEAESENDLGTPVSARSFADSREIEVFLVGSDGGSTRILDQSHVEPGARTLAVRVGGDLSVIDKVYVSDGAAYRVEAVLQNDRYVCSFSIEDDALYQIILIEAVHSDGRASKEKRL